MRGGDSIKGSRPPAPLEAAVQQTITDTATLLRWRWYHPFDSRRSAGGYPDLTLVRDRVVFAELKRAGKQPEPDQVEWLDALAGGGAEVYLWRLSDYEEIKRILSRDWKFFPSIGSARGLGQLDLKYGDAARSYLTDFWTPASLWIPGHGRSDA